MTTTSATPEVGNEFYRDLLMNIFNSSYGRERPGYIQHQSLLRLQFDELNEKISKIDGLAKLAAMFFPAYALLVLVISIISTSALNEHIVFAPIVIVGIYLLFQLAKQNGFVRRRDKLKNEIDEEELLRFDEAYALFWVLRKEEGPNFSFSSEDDFTNYVNERIKNLVLWVVLANRMGAYKTEEYTLRRATLKTWVNLAVHLGVCGADKTGLLFDGGSQMFYSGQARVLFARLFTQDKADKS